MYLQQIKENEIFHVHTHRCKHASLEKEEDYILKAIEMGMEKITFADHAPFPRDPFTNRMTMEELNDYINTLTRLREKYGEEGLNLIEVGIGLEIEYLPVYKGYYEKLLELNQLDFLMLGQHFFQCNENEFSFMDLKMDKENEVRYLCEAMIEAMSTGMFGFVAHPDRVFKNVESWTKTYNDMSLAVVAAANKNGVVLEKNLNSIKKCIYRREFWDLVYGKYVLGVDAHSVEELKLINLEVN